MEEAFWMIWKLATPILAVAVVWLLLERHTRYDAVDELELAVVEYRRHNADLVRKLAEAQLDAAEAQSIANILRHRDAATCPCSEVKTLQDRNTYLEERTGKAPQRAPEAAQMATQAS
jgi:hypothetical protein